MYKIISDTSCDLSKEEIKELRNEGHILKDLLSAMNLPKSTYYYELNLKLMIMNY